LSPRTAERLGVFTTKHDAAPLVQLQYAGRSLPNQRFPHDVPVWILPGHPDGSVTLSLGYGRERAGRVGGIDGESRGFNAYALRTSDAPHGGGGITITATGRTGRIACTQDHQVIPDERDDDIVREHTVAQFIGELHTPADKPHAGAERGHGEGEQASLYPEYDYSKGRAWGWPST
jgi:molybdopterin-containing oxidoreductase family iron-sulfur binding subunit